MTEHPRARRYQSSSGEKEEENKKGGTETPSLRGRVSAAKPHPQPKPQQGARRNENESKKDSRNEWGRRQGEPERRGRREQAARREKETLGEQAWEQYQLQGTAPSVTWKGEGIRKNRGDGKYSTNRRRANRKRREATFEPTPVIW